MKSIHIVYNLIFFFVVVALVTFNETTIFLLNAVAWKSNTQKYRIGKEHTRKTIKSIKRAMFSTLRAVLNFKVAVEVAHG